MVKLHHNALFGQSMQQAIKFLGEGQCRAYDLTRKFGRRWGISQCKHNARHCSATASMGFLSQIVGMLLSLPEMSSVVDMDCAAFMNIAVNLNHEVALVIPPPLNPLKRRERRKASG